MLQRNLSIDLRLISKYYKFFLKGRYGHMEIIKKLLDGNREWVAQRLGEDENFFKKLAEGQAPHTLWIGCADSRIPANEVTKTQPGEIFVHRNIANMVIHSDMNMLSVLDYAVNVLEVKNVVVCGHYMCGGIKAAMTSNQYGLIDNWLRHIKDVYRLHEDLLDGIEDENERFERFVEVSVYEQVYNLTKTSIIQNSWASKQSPKLHGWVIDLKTGLIKDLGITFTNNVAQLPDFYKIKNKALV